jgi:hypothetical protein
MSGSDQASRLGIIESALEGGLPSLRSNGTSMPGVIAHRWQPLLPKASLGSLSFDADQPLQNNNHFQQLRCLQFILGEECLPLLLLRRIRSEHG